ncbi:hypothetical protein [Vreelandella malpeensis]|uniref:Uncharacterized protein n=1 Tax=Vreelandella malpeensis TaxID=1172368 RepID=A0ABS8DS23_9GAMM|nr:hypothetical protein [Halomonas malpeensis]MCB8889039.1 hypothetical protein [Halomonas malpeensis]
MLKELFPMTAGKAFRKLLQYILCRVGKHGIKRLEWGQLTKFNPVFQGGIDLERDSIDAALEPLITHIRVVTTSFVVAFPFKVQRAAQGLLSIARLSTV